MRVHTIERRQRIAGSADALFAFFSDAHNLESITPPWLRFEVVSPPRELGVGSELRYRLRLHGIPVRWLTRIAVWEPPRRFVDVQLRGPYRLWHHTHSLEPDGEHVVMHDLVRYALPLGPLGGLAHRALVRSDLARIFDFRRDAIVQRFGSPESS